MQYLEESPQAGEKRYADPLACQEGRCQHYQSSSKKEAIASSIATIHAGNSRRISFLTSGLMRLTFFKRSEATKISSSDSDSQSQFLRLKAT